MDLDIWASLVAQMVKNPPAVKEIQVQSLGLEDPLQKEMATHSSILTWRISWAEEPGRLQFMGSERVEHNRVTYNFTSLSGISGSLLPASFNCYLSPSGASINSQFSLRIKSNSEEPESTSTQSLFPS